MKMQECLEKTHRDYAKPLGEFDCDNRQFASLKPFLGDYLVSAFEEDTKKAKPKPEKTPPKNSAKWPWVVGTIALLAGLWFLSSLSGQRKQLKAARRMLATPEQVTMEIKRNTLHIKGEAVSYTHLTLPTNREV